MKGCLSTVSLLVGLVCTLAAGTVILPIPKSCPRQNSLDATVFLSHESNCSLFYICLNGKKIERICPLLDKEGNRLHFNPQLQVCDKPENVKCESTIKSPLSNGKISEKVETTTPAWQNPKTCIGSCPIRDPEDHVVLLKNQDCTKYCMCHDGRAIVNVCPPGLQFSLEKQVCTWPEDSDCEESKDEIEGKNSFQFVIQNLLENELIETSTESWKNPSNCKDKCPKRDPEDRSILLEHNDCSKYCMCNNGTPIVNICGPGLHFSLKLQTCTWPIEAQCQQTNTFLQQ